MKIESYSQCGQDLFVFSLIKNKGKFLDLGCYLPKKINNTYLLELNDWDGVSIDIIDYSEQWEERSTKFINQDCFNIDFEHFLPKYFNTKIIDYLSLDMEKIGERYKLLEKILNTNYEFKVITIEHDSYLGHEFEINEKIPQREILINHGYILLCSDVSQKNHPTLYYEDWWVNKKYFNESDVNNWFSDKLSCDEIFKKVGVDYLINDASLNW
jgi:hypothetical protein